MLKIAICDDNSEDRDNIKELIKNYDFRIVEFSSGEELIEKIDNTYDLIFLDILMKKLDGVETMIELNSKSINSYVIFISSFDERIRDLFGNKTLAFIDKPINRDIFLNKLDYAIQLINLNNTYFVYKTNGLENRIKLADIVYFESRRNKIILTDIFGNKTMFYSTVQSLWDNIKKNNRFIRTSRSHIFNLDNIIITKTSVNYNNCNPTF